MVNFNFPMVSLFAEIVLVSFWPKSLDYSSKGVLIKFLYALITPHWKVLQS